MDADRNSGKCGTGCCGIGIILKDKESENPFRCIAGIIICIPGNYGASNLRCEFKICETFYCGMYRWCRRWSCSRYYACGSKCIRYYRCVWIPDHHRLYHGISAGYGGSSRSGIYPFMDFISGEVGGSNRDSTGDS